MNISTSDPWGRFAAKWSTDRRYAATTRLSVARNDGVGCRARRRAVAGPACPPVPGTGWRYVDPAVPPARRHAVPPPRRALSSEQPRSVEPVEPPPPSGPLPRPRAAFPWVDRVWHDWRADPVDRFGVVLFFVIATIVVSSLVNAGTSYGDSLLAHTMSGLALVAAARATGMRRRARRVLTVVVVLAVTVLAALSLADARPRRGRPGVTRPGRPAVAAPRRRRAGHRHPPDRPAHGRRWPHRAGCHHGLPADRGGVRRPVPGRRGLELGATPSARPRSPARTCT